MTHPLNDIETQTANWTPRDWTNDSGQKINADALNHINDGIQEALDGIQEALDAIEQLTPSVEAISFEGGGSAQIIKEGNKRTLIIKSCNRTFTNSWQSFTLYKLPESERPTSHSYSGAIQNDNSATGHVILGVNGDKTSAEWGYVQLHNKGGTYPEGNCGFYGEVTWVVGH